MSRPRRDLLAIDTDVLIHWAMAGSRHHRDVRNFLEGALLPERVSLALVQQTLTEFLHVTTDARRFDQPLSMAEALRLSQHIWNSDSVESIVPPADVYDRTCDLMRRFRLGRKRIHDTTLAATLEAAGIVRLATLNQRDFKIFPFLEIVDPLETADL